MRTTPKVPLEVFVHGALCVSYSGRCYASQACYGRSANRGACAQVCRLPFHLEDAQGARAATQQTPAVLERYEPHRPTRSPARCGCHFLEDRRSLERYGLRQKRRSRLPPSSRSHHGPSSRVYARFVWSLPLSLHPSAR